MCGLSPPTSLGCSAELKAGAGELCCLLQSPGTAPSLLFSHTVLSVGQPLPFSLFVMSCCHARPSSLQSPSAILSPNIFYGITLHPTPPVCPHCSWLTALEHTAAPSVPLSVMKKVYSLQKPQAHMVQHLICFKSLKSQVANPALCMCLGVRAWISPGKGHLPAFKGSSFALM